MKESSSEKALEYMQKFHDMDSDYFQSKYHQREARQGYIDLFKLDQKKGEDIWNHTFPKFLRRNKLKKEDFLKTRSQKPKFSDINAIIRPEPQDIILEKHPVEIINEEIIERTQNSQVISQLQIQNTHIEPESIEFVFDGLWMLLKLKWPLESLTQEQKESLGRMWLPAFKKYLSEHWMYIGIPLISTIGIFGVNIIESRDKKKKREHKEIQDKK
jgi:hypothetical protein